MNVDVKKSNERLFNTQAVWVHIISERLITLFILIIGDETPYHNLLSVYHIYI